MKKLLIFILLAVIIYEIPAKNWQKFTPEERDLFKIIAVEKYFISNPLCAMASALTEEKTDQTEITIDCIEEIELEPLPNMQI